MQEIKNDLVGKKLSISIVVYETPLIQLLRCIKSLERTEINFHIYVIDHSPQNSLKLFLTAYSNITYIHNPGNPGFGAGHNMAIECSRKKNYEYHLVINPDVYFDSDVLSPMLNFMDSNSQVGQMMPKVLNLDGTIQYVCKLVPTPIDLFFRRFTFGSIKRKRSQIFELHVSGYSRIMFVPFLSGCFMLMKHSALIRVGMFDERFFMYAEDIDLTRRIAEKYETLFFPSVEVYHEIGGASHKSLKMFLVHLISVIKYFNKWGWFNDPLRDMLNKKTLSLLQIDTKL